MGIRIRGMLSVVPANVRTIDDLAARYGTGEAKRLVEATGVEKVRLVSPGQTTVDLVEHAGRRLLAQLGVSPGDVQGVILVSGFADFIVPASACMLQNRLGLPKQSMAFDVNLQCSGCPYGLAIAGGLLNLGLAQRILLFIANAPSLLVHPDDKTSFPLFGDAAAAVLLESDPAANDFLGFDLGTDGAGWKNLLIAVGRCRYPTLDQFSESAPEPLRCIAHPKHVYMNGARIFTFVLREVPGIAQRTLANAGVQAEAVDYYLFHQANKFILGHVIRKMELPEAKCPLSIDHFGNTSGALPILTACDALSAINRERELTAMFLGFGVGYSWGGALTRLAPGALLPVEEV